MVRCADTSAFLMREAWLFDYVGRPTASPISTAADAPPLIE